MRCKQKGYTLIELMIVVAIIAILAGIAYPLYIHYVEQSRRSTAITALQQAAAAEEKHYAAYNAYAVNLTGLPGYTKNSVDIPSSQEHWYTLTIGADTSGGSAYKITATPTGAQAKDACGTFILTATGARTVSNSSGKSATDCWGSG